MARRKTARAQPTRTASKAKRKQSLTAQEVKRPAIASLSADILVQIFQLYIGAHKGAYYFYWQPRPNPHAVIALVCRFWKDILYGCKLLWRDVDLTKEQSNLFFENARGAPLRITWNASSLYRLRDDTTSFPWEMLKPLKDSIEALMLTDSRTMLLMLNDATLPALRELVFDDHPPYRGPSSAALQHFVIRAPSLTRLALRSLQVTGLCLYELLQGCSALERFELVNAFIEYPSLARDSISLPHLRSLVCGSLGVATLSVLCAIREIPAQAAIRMELGPSDFKTVYDSPDFQKRFCPLDFARVNFANSTVMYTEDPHTACGRPHFVILTHLGFQFLNNWAAFQPRELVDARLLRRSVLDVLQLHHDISLPGGRERFIPIAQLPPFRTIEVRDNPASLLFSWLRRQASNARARLLECLVLEDVQFKTVDPAAPLIRQMLSEKDYARWKEQYQAFTDLEEVLRERHDGGSPLKLVLRSGTYDHDVVEQLRPLARPLEIEMAVIIPPDPPVGRIGRAARGTRP